MKKQYSKPTMNVVLLQNRAQLLAGSGYGGKLNAPEFTPDGEDWTDKFYEFGGWDTEDV